MFFAQLSTTPRPIGIYLYCQTEAWAWAHSIMRSSIQVHNHRMALYTRPQLLKLWCHVVVRYYTRPQYYFLWARMGQFRCAFLHLPTRTELLHTAFLVPKEIKSVNFCLNGHLNAHFKCVWVFLYAQSALVIFGYFVHTKTLLKTTILCSPDIGLTVVCQPTAPTVGYGNWQSTGIKRENEFFTLLLYNSYCTPSQ